MHIYLDFETGSDVDLMVEGRARYMHHPSTYVQICSFQIDDEPMITETVHTGFQSFAKAISEYVITKQAKIVAFNAQFEMDVIHYILGLEVTPHDFIDVQAVCGRYGLPQDLEKATAVMCPQQIKDSAGSSLIKHFRTVPKRLASTILTGPQWDRYVMYNMQDVTSTKALLAALPSSSLSKREQAIWELNCDINAIGLPMAVDEAAKILEVTTVYMEEQNNILPDITNGKVTKITQVKRIKEFINEAMGYEFLESLTADKLEKVMNDEHFLELPDSVVSLIELRASLGLSSIGKYKRIMSMEHNGRMYDNSRYYGAHTGRITGMGFQLLNLPRASVKDVESEIAAYFDFSICERNPVKSARALIRSMIKAPDGKYILAADYSAIEYILLIWLAEDYVAVQRFAQKFDQYIDMAAEIYNTTYEQVVKDQRQTGKVGILGCGYGMGAQKLIAYAERIGVILSMSEAQTIVQAYRTKYPLVVKMWYALMKCAMNALRNEGYTFTTNRVQFKVVIDRNNHRWLQMLLPSGRAMYYYDPKIAPGLYGDTLSYMGMDQTTKTYMRQYSTPGKLTENVIQALGRDILYDGKFKCRENGLNIIGSIYDEVICEESFEHDPKERRALLETCMCHTEPWAEGLPLRAEGWYGPRYKKA